MKLFQIERRCIELFVTGKLDMYQAYHRIEMFVDYLVRCGQMSVVGGEAEKDVFQERLEESIGCIR